METGTSSPSSSAPDPTTVEDIFGDYCARRKGLIRALTRDVDQLFESCDPDKETLCLFGYPDESWKLNLPSEMVPFGIPEPAIGINFARDAEHRNEWVYLVSVHSDSWLTAVAFYYGGSAKLNSVESYDSMLHPNSNALSNVYYTDSNQVTHDDARLWDRLFNLINSLPRLHEVVRDWHFAKDKPRKDQSGEASRCKSRSSAKRSSDGKTKSTKKIVEESCGCCMLVHNKDEFWIACDVCQLWYHGKCVGITPTMAQTMGDYECPFCRKSRTGL